MIKEFNQFLYKDMQQRISEGETCPKCGEYKIDAQDYNYASGRNWCWSCETEEEQGASIMDK